MGFRTPGVQNKLTTSVIMPIPARKSGPAKRGLRLELALRTLRGNVFFANCYCKTKLRNAAKHMGCDIRAAWSVAYVLSQLFFHAVGICKAALNDDSRHRYGYCSPKRCWRAM